MEIIEQTKPTAGHLSGNKKIKIFCNEQLSPKNQRIFGKARNIWSNYFVWTGKGKVLCQLKVNVAKYSHNKSQGTAEGHRGPG